MSQINSQYPFDSFKEDRVCTNGEASSTISAGVLVYKVSDTTDQVKIATNMKAIGHVGIALTSGAAGATLRVRFLGRVTSNDTGGTLNTNSIGNAGEPFSSTAAGAIANTTAVADRPYGFVVVKHATTGEIFINGLQA